MKDIEEVKLTISSSIKSALTVIGDGAVKIALVVDEGNRLLGTLTDGDIRRAMIKGFSLEDTIENIYFKSPITVNISTSKEEVAKICFDKKIYQIPVIDHNGIVISLHIFDDLLRPKIHLNKVVLMVGGLGSRLRPLTDKTPKPMLLVGNKPILQTIVERFVSYGFVNIIMCVNYKSHIIQNYFGDGRDFGANIEYIFEDKRMGTAGALSLLGDRPQEPFFVMNGDLLTNINFEHVLEFQLSSSVAATMCVREYDFEVPYGVVNILDRYITSIDEKPVHNFFVNAGIYILNSSCMRLIPDDEFYDMPQLFEKLIKLNERVASFPLKGYWMDIGKMHDYERAQQDYEKIFGEI